MPILYITHILIYSNLFFLLRGCMAIPRWCTIFQVHRIVLRQCMACSCWCSSNFRGFEAHGAVRFGVRIKPQKDNCNGGGRKALPASFSASIRPKKDRLRCHFTIILVILQIILVTLDIENTIMQEFRQKRFVQTQ